MKKLLLSLVMALVSCVMVMAQVTTSSMSGMVLDSEGELIGATVQAVHTPSGTTYGAITNAAGNYSIEGMRVGGPYTIKVSYIGYQTKTYTDVTLVLGENFNLNVELSSSADQLEEVIVVGTASKFAGQKTGAAINISNKALSQMPTVSRSISDIARLSPYAGGSNSFAGGDGRSTNFTIDGANFNNNFGLSSSLPGGGNPISLDAIDEIQVVVSPFDVRQSNFIGGGINAITKSGTNTFRGTAYTYYRDQDLRGNRVHGTHLGDRAKEKKQIYGFTLGGPIIKNKLFFFVNYELEKTPGQVIKYRAAKSAGEGGKDMISRTTEEDLKKASDHLQKTYGYDPGSYTSFPGDEENYRLLGRLDWNITNDHRLSLRYNRTKNTAWNAPNGNSVDVKPRLNNTYRVGLQSMAFANTMYSMDNLVESWALDLNSRFGNSASNQLLATYTNIEDIRGTNSSEFPMIDIMYDGTTNGGPYMSAGYELFTYNNGVKNKIFNIKDDFKYNYGDHQFLAGISFEHQFANNAYMRNGTGYYRYATLDDFLNNRTPESFALTYGYNGVKDPNAQVTFNQLSFYLQDDWKVNKNFKLNYGIRFDELMFDESDILTNKAIYALDFGGKKVDTGKWPGSNMQISPRVGFSWDVFGDNSFKLRGGTGLFAGRLPLVFFTNQPTNAALVQITQSLSSSDGKESTLASLKKLQKADGSVYTKVDEMISALGLQTNLTDNNHQAGSKISGVVDDFKMPQVWKTSIAADYNLPTSFPFNVTAEAMFTKNISAVWIENINVKDPKKANMAKFSGADDRYIYSDYTYVSGKNAVILDNTSKGYGYTFNVTLNAEPVKNLQLMAAYTMTESKEVSGMPGSDPVSTWQGMYSVNGPNAGEVQRSQYVTPHKLIASVNYTIAKTGTSFNLFYQGFSYSGNSFIYDNDMNGDGVSTDLIYIPASKDEIKFVDMKDKSGNVTYTAAQQADAFWAFVNQDSYLKNHKGEYAEAYAARAPWYNRMDLRVTQDFSFKTGSQTHKFQISADIQNFGNLLSSHWGVYETNASCKNGAVLHYAGKDANNVPTFTMNEYDGKLIKDSYTPLKSDANTWRLQLGLKYFFN